MREIKFRAWNYNSKEMICDITGFVQDLNKEKIRIFRMNRGMLDGMSTELFLSRDITVEQYTGLKDCNGVEIYEGDIVSYWKMSKKVRNFGAVQFEAPYYTVGGKDENCHYKLDRGEDLEIIGNIHEEG